MNGRGDTHDVSPKFPHLNIQKEIDMLVVISKVMKLDRNNLIFSQPTRVTKIENAIKCIEEDMHDHMAESDDRFLIRVIYWEIKIVGPEYGHLIHGWHRAVTYTSNRVYTLDTSPLVVGRS